MEILQYQPIDKLTSYFNKDKRLLIEDLQMTGFLSNATYCKLESCMEPLVLLKTNTKTDTDKDVGLGYALVCRNCKRSISLLLGSFFEGRKNLPPFEFKQWFIVFQCWSTLIKAKALALLLNSKLENIVKAYMCIRDICTWKLMNHPELFQFGGENSVIEVDEKFFPNEQKLKKPPSVYSNEWVLVIYDVTIRRGAIIFVPGILSDQVNIIVKNHIKTGTIVKLQPSSLLNKLPVFSEENSFKIEELENCKDFSNLIKRNSCCIHGYWKRFINYLIEKGVLTSLRVPQHIDEFLWRDIFGKTSEDAYQNLLCQIRERFPCK